MTDVQLIREPADLGRIIRAARVRQGLWQEQLAEVTGLHRTYLSGIESGRRTMMVQRTLELLHALDLDLAVVERRREGGGPRASTSATPSPGPGRDGGADAPPWPRDPNGTRRRPRPRRLGDQW